MFAKKVFLKEEVKRGSEPAVSQKINNYSSSFLY